MDLTLLAARAQYNLHVAETREGSTNLRISLMAGEFDAKLDLQVASNALETIATLPVDAMPPSTLLVAMLLEMAAQRYSEPDHDAVWNSIGISTRRGKHLLTVPGSNTFDWPTWFTLRGLALRDE